MLRIRVEEDGKDERFIDISDELSAAEFHVGNGLVRVTNEPDDGCWSIEAFNDAIMMRNPEEREISPSNPIASLYLDGIAILAMEPIEFIGS